MITPDYLEYQLNCLDVHKSLQESILKDIARRMIKNPHKLTETVEWQVQKLQEAGYLYSDIIRGLAKITGALESEICFLFEDAQTEIFNYDDEVVVSSGKKAEEIKNISPKMKNIWNAATKKTVTEAINLTKTTANTSHSAYIRACDLAHMQVSSGAFDYVTAIRNGIKAAAKQGVTVTYPSGWKDTLDVAIRRSVLTGVNQTAGELQEMRAKEMHHDIMELTAHSGAREEHARWQGKLVSLSGKKGYLSLRDIGYGEPGGFKGINCRHNWHMYFKGMPRAYTDKELKDMQNEKVVYNGQPIPVWKAREYQRSLERGIKKNKRELIMCNEARKYTDDKDLKAGLDIDFQNAAKKLKAREKNLKDFCRQTGLKYDSSRVQVFSAETERGIRNWDKSIAQTAVAANKKALTKEREDGIIKEKEQGQEVQEVREVHYIGKIDKNVYKCVTEDIRTDEVIITDERIQHIKERHPNDYERYCSYIPYVISEPDYIIEANKSNTAVLLKEIEIEAEKFKLVLRMAVKSDPAGYKNSVISFWKVGDTTWNKTLKNKKVLYKSE